MSALSIPDLCADLLREPPAATSTQCFCGADISGHLGMCAAHTDQAWDSINLFGPHDDSSLVDA